jgi:hypothetical protein
VSPHLGDPEMGSGTIREEIPGEGATVTDFSRSWG